jgi:hypothetical protein
MSSQDVLNKSMALTYLVEDTTSIALNIVGGPAQEVGVDFYIKDGEIRWDGYPLESEISQGDILRAVYKAKGLSDPVEVKIKLSSHNEMSFEANGTHIGWDKKLKYTSQPWQVSFYMNQSNADIDHDAVFGRGYVSKFTAIATSIQGTDKAVPYQLKTWRQPILMYNQSNRDPE